MKKGQITMENGDNILVEFYPDDEPKTVKNFEKLANDGHGFENGERRYDERS